jgi:peptidoglycan hydrolase-like protein with peptidoglycan-binding domain
MARRQRAFLWATSVAAVVAIGGLIASTMVKSPAELAASQGAPQPSVLTAEVQSKVLAQQVVVRGNVVAGGSEQVTPTAAQGASALIVTGEPVTAGSKISPGEVIAQVSGRPIIALPGSVPAYRDLKPGDQGSDISELQSALRSLGYADGDPSGTFGPETKTAAKALYQHLGYDPATTGGHDDQGDQSALEADAQAVTSAEHTLTQAREQLARDQKTTPSDAAAVTADQQAVQWDQQSLAAAQQAGAQEIENTGYELPMNEFVFIPTFPATLVSINGAVGATVASPLLVIDTGRLVVDAVVQQSDEAMLKQGMDVEIDSEVLGRSAPGTLTTLGPYSADATASQQGQNTGSESSGQGAQPGQSQGTPGYPITVTPSSSLDPTSWLGQNVRLTITAAKTPGKVLAVPVAAITTDATGRTSVLVYHAKTGAEQQVAVTVGVTADGMCAVTPAIAGALIAGDTVVTGQ